jgi:arginyl-tRNA synthetase
LHEKEIELIYLLADFKKVIKEAESTYNPALVANYIYEVAKGYNSFYHELSVLNADNEQQKLFRIQVSYKCALVVKQAMQLLCVEVPERM